MNEFFKLGDRLEKCAEYVPENAKLLDIGTDHAYLPIWLLLNNKIKSAIAADINKDPLALAVENAKKYKVNIKTVLSNGFENVEKEDFDCVVIAGMGGELIANIIENGKDAISSTNTLILQAMSKSSKLREYLFLNNYYIEKEEAVMHKGKIYSVMKVTKNKLENQCLYMGAIKVDSLYSIEYANSVVRDLKNTLHGLKGESYSRIEDKIIEIERKYKL